ncbi:MarR family transcriptional regulator [Leucobacter chinensis]|uniref:MarR family transcriptional regulator n=1 Tax=Leucobacter chinensis TaxID=2851010 RepID=UPI001C2432A6|nr:MarR family transcriptional regulator [Leucobacter chinensis]
MHELKHMLPTQFLRMRELMMVRFRAVFATVNMTDAQWRTLRAVHEAGTIDFAVLSERALVAKPSLSRVLSSLEARGFVARSGVASDLRQVKVSLTEEGNAFVISMWPLIDAVYESLEHDLGPVRLAEVSEAVAHCITLLEDADTAHTTTR